MREILAVVIPVTKMITHLESETVTMPSVIPLVTTLMEEMNSIIDKTAKGLDKLTTDAGSEFCQTLIQQITERLGPYCPSTYNPQEWKGVNSIRRDMRDSVLAAATAMVLDPTRKTSQVPPMKRKGLKQLVLFVATMHQDVRDLAKRRLAAERCRSAPEAQVSSEAVCTVDGATKGLRADGTIAYDVPISSGLPEIVSAGQVERYIMRELDNYLNDKVDVADRTDATCTVVPPDINALSWWSNNCDLYPAMAILAKRYLGIPPSSSSSERLFKTGSLNLSKKRRRLSQRNIRNSMVVGSTSPSEWKTIISQSDRSPMLKLNGAADKHLAESDLSGESVVAAEEPSRSRLSTFASDLKKIQDILPLRLFDSSWVAQLLQGDGNNSPELHTGLVLEEENIYQESEFEEDGGFNDDDVINSPQDDEDDEDYRPTTHVMRASAELPGASADAGEPAMAQLLTSSPPKSLAQLFRPAEPLLLDPPATANTEALPSAPKLTLQDAVRGAEDIVGNVKKQRTDILPAAQSLGAVPSCQRQAREQHQEADVDYVEVSVGSVIRLECRKNSATGRHGLFVISSEDSYEKVCSKKHPHEFDPEPIEFYVDRIGRLS